MKITTLAVAMTALAAPAFAQSAVEASGDAAEGEQRFQRQCIACHVIQDPETGEVLAGRSSRVGPNLYGVAGRQLGTVEGFNYSDALVELGETGQVWTEEAFVGYVQDPTGWLREELDDRRARGKMAYQVRDEQDAYDLYAYFATFGAEAQ
ncbi:c-type cytochrome [Salipiger sp. IMCC34102]|uniref:c-type cytochrome n=1 Tax=Salipiger sp. IMCC34102 TaxID=2510647 RepID=UPI00101E1B22|nr:c-type cytochrome [Salipiger sp. IMCC34102]RYH01698.1 c-type cytochrome [Salipiger sp. IMCC34102]